MPEVWERTMPYSDLEGLKGRYVCVVLGECLLLNWWPGQIVEENGVYYLEHKAGDGTGRYRIRRREENISFKLGDGIWMGNEFLGQIV